MQHNLSLSDFRDEWPLTSSRPFDGYNILLDYADRRQRPAYAKLLGSISDGTIDAVEINACEIVELPVRATTARRMPQRCIRQFPAELARVLDPHPTVNVLIPNRPYSHDFCVQLCHVKQWNATYGCFPSKLSKYFRYPATDCKDDVVHDSVSPSTISYTDCGCRPACETNEFEMLGINRVKKGSSNFEFDRILKIRSSFSFLEFTVFKFSRCKEGTTYNVFSI